MTLRAMSPHIRRAVWDRDRGICGICALPVPFGRDMHVDHIQPRCEGGPDALENLRATHGTCNRRRPRPCPLPGWPVAITLRLDQELHERVGRMAQNQDRTLTGQIVRLIREGVDQFEAAHPDLVQAEQQPAPRRKPRR